MLRRAVEQSCSLPPAGKRLPTFFLIILDHYYQQDILVQQKKKETLVLFPLSYCSIQQTWSASDECPSGAGSKCKFRKEHLANITTGSMLSGLSDFPLLQKNPHILNLFCSCMAGRGVWLAGSITQVWFTWMSGCAIPEKLQNQGQLVNQNLEPGILMAPSPGLL